MWAVATAFSLLAAAAPAGGQDITLWPDGAPGAKGTANTDIPTMKVFPAPKDVSGPVPAVLLIPGGGYKHISSYSQYWSLFQTKPVRFFSMRYRLPTDGYQHPAPLQDACRAMRTIRAKAKEWNVDPNRIVVIAFSSGGHVASTLATHFTPGDPNAKDPIERFSSRPDYMALFCPVVSMIDHPHTPSVARLLGPNPGEALLRDLSNELQVTARTPPTFLAHAKDDTLVPPENSILFHEALKKAGVMTELHIYPTGGHGVTNDGNPWKQDLDAWLVKCGVLPKQSGPAAGTPADKPMTRLSYGSRLIERVSSGKHHGVKVDAVSLQRLAAWVDAMCPYIGDEEVRQIDDSVFQGVEWLAIPPRIRTAPRIVRPGPVD
jgi:acetyl esterase/lipase